MTVSIYNHQFCALKPSLWPFTKKSISDWKNLCFPECEQCSALDNEEQLIRTRESFELERPEEVVFQSGRCRMTISQTRFE